MSVSILTNNTYFWTLVEEHISNLGHGDQHLFAVGNKTNQFSYNYIVNYKYLINLK